MRGQKRMDAPRAREWRVGDPARAVELYRAATKQHPNAGFAWAQLAGSSPDGAAAEAAEAYEHLAAAAQSLSSATRRAAGRQRCTRIAPTNREAAALLRALLVDAPGDLEATAELLDIVALEKGAQARKERVGLRSGWRRAARIPASPR